MQHSSKKVLALGLIVLLAAISRLIPHPMNFAPLGAMALFGAAYFGNRGLGLLLTMIAWFISDLVLNNFIYQSAEGFTLFTGGSFFIYASIVLIFGLGTIVMKKVDFPRVVAGSLGATFIFFVLSNLGVWAQNIMYPMTFGGLVACYTAALPFLKYTLAGDLFYSGLLFLAYERYMRSLLREDKITR